MLSRDSGNSATPVRPSWTGRDKGEEAARRFRTRARASIFGFALGAIAAIAAADASDDPAAAVADPVARLSRSLEALALAPEGLDLRIAPPTVDSAATKQAPLAAGTPIAQEEVEKLLSRLPAPKETVTASQAPVLRPATAPPPRTGEVVRTPFPPPPGPAPAAPERVARPLEVVRWKPEGEVGRERNVTVVFNQPMVPLTSAEESAKSVPVRLTPQPPGKWSWLDPKTLQFRPDLRFPHSTSYEVEVPAGTTSLAGTTLAEAKTFRFETPALRIESSYPSAARTRAVHVPIVVLFNQAIDAAVLLREHVKVTANNAPVHVRLLEPAELAAAEKSDTELAHFLAEPRKAGHESRLLALAPDTGELPKDAAIAVEIGAGAASAEGPNRTRTALLAGFRTYAPLRIVKAGCYAECGEGDTYSVEFNNQLAKDASPEDQVRVSPDVADLEIRHEGDTLSFSGSTRPRTSYTVTLPAQLRDIFGQTLGSDQTREWKTGDVEAKLEGPWGLQVLEPAPPGREPVLELLSRRFPRLDVRLYRVEIADHAAFESYLYAYLDEDFSKKRREPPGIEVFHEIVRPQDAGDELATTPIALAPALSDEGFGHVVAVVETVPPSTESYGDRVVAWLQSTQLGIDAIADAQEVVVFVSELATGKPAAGVEVTLQPAGTTALTDERGIVTVPLAGTSFRHIVARRGKDTAFLEKPSYYGGYSALGAAASQTAWYVVDDRGTYRPGEEVTIKGWLRNVDHRKHGDVDLATGAATVSYVVYDAQRTRIAEATAVVSANGSFDTRFKLPATPNLGTATVELSAKGTRLPAGASTTHAFEIREFRRPEYEVSASVAEGPHLLGGSADVTAKAGYFAGGPLPQAPVKWSLASSRAAFVPPGHDGYEFGVVSSWYGGYDDDEGSGYFQTEKTWSADGLTDSNGTHSLRLDLPSARPAVPMAVSAEAEVRDVNRQAWTGKTRLLVHPGDLYVGVRLTESFVERGGAVTVSVLGVDHDGTKVPGAAIEVKAARVEREWNRATNAYDSSESDVQRCHVTSGEEPATCTFQANERGSYTIVATIVDSKGRPSQTEASFYSSSYEIEPSRSVEQEKIELVADRKDYAPGDTARLSVSAPFYPADAVVTVQRSGILETRHLRLERPSTVEVAITEAMLPNVYVQVDAVGSVARKAGPGSTPPPRPAYATGSIALKVPPRIRTLDVRVTPGDASVAPAAQTSLGVEVRDASGARVEGAEVAVFVVDEAILALGNHRLPEPVASFYPQRSDGTYALHSREYVRLRSQDGEGGAYGELAEAMAAPFGEAPPLFLREDFNPLAAFFPALVTGADGRATASFKLPDSVTRYRIFAIAASGAKRFGKGESTLAARLPLVARPSAPRFLNFGDVFELPVVVQNQTDRASTVRVALRTQNLELTAGAGREVTIPANDRVEVRFPAAASLAGEAAFQVVAVGDAGEDAAAAKLPVWTPATTEAFATYGVIDEGAVHQPVSIPSDVWEDFGGLDVTTASTNLQSLTDAFLYLVHYPFECGEQIASRILAIVALQDVLAAFRAPELPGPEALRAQLRKDVTELLKKQKTSGGFVFWKTEEAADPYVSIHATNALVRARARGIEVPAEALANALEFISNVEPSFRPEYTPAMRQVLSAFALHTRSLAGDVDADKVRKLVEQAGGADKLPLEAAAWLLGTLAKQDVPEKKALLRHILNRATETAGAASFTSDYEDVGRLLLASNRRTDAIVLDALIAAEPENDLIPRVVTGLLAHRKAGRWLNTQENVYILLALDRYFRTYEKVEPDFVAQMWLGSDYAGEHAFKGRTTESREVSIPTRELTKRSGQSLVIAKKGKGRLYYRAGIRLAPKSFAIGATDRGFIVERRYEGADDPADVVRQPDGSWKIRLGARVRVVVQAFNEARRYQVALVDPLPAGLEPVAPKASPDSKVVYGCWFDADADFYNWWNPVWFQHQNLRDERAEAFTSQLAPGDHVYEYVARATTPGTFVVPPARAEEMYMPETFGRSASTIVVVQ